jgi:serine/threonine protein kinase
METGEDQPSNADPIRRRLVESNVIWERYAHISPIGSRSLSTYFHKPITEEDETGEDLQRIVQRQASRRKLVRHEAILPIEKVDVVSDKEVGFFEPMPYGNTLGNLIRKTGRLRLDFVASLIWILSEAVEELHNAGLGHFSLTPEKVVISKDGRVSILDVGVAEIGREMIPGFSFPDTRWEKLFNNPAFTAPEMLTPGRFSRTADTFAIAGITYNMLAGARPFVGEDTMEIYHQIRSGDKPSIRQYFPELPHSVDRGIQEGLSPAPEDRPMNPTMLAEILFGEKKRIDDMSFVCRSYEKMLSDAYLDRHLEGRLDLFSRELASSWSPDDQKEDNETRFNKASLMLDSMKTDKNAEDISRKVSIFIAIVALAFVLLAIPFLFSK